MDVPCCGAPDGCAPARRPANIAAASPTPANPASFRNCRRFSYCDSLVISDERIGCSGVTRISMAGMEEG